MTTTLSLTFPALADETAIAKLVNEYEQQLIAAQTDHDETKHNFYDDPELEAHIATYDAALLEALKTFKQADLDTYVRYLELEHTHNYEAARKLEATSAAYRTFAAAEKVAYAPLASRFEELSKVRDAARVGAQVILVARRSLHKQKLIEDLEMLMNEQ